MITGIMEFVKIWFEQGFLFSTLLVLTLIILVVLIVLITSEIKEKLIKHTKKRYIIWLLSFSALFFILIVVLLFLYKPKPTTEIIDGLNESSVQSELISQPLPIPLHERDIDELKMSARPWQVAYYDLLSNPLSHRPPAKPGAWFYEPLKAVKNLEPLKRHYSNNFRCSYL